jgi:GTP-binding protein
MSGNRSFVVADVPGLIEGAHEGRGLGDRFLKHLDRTKVLVHLVDVSGASGRSPIEDFETIRRELALFSEELESKPQIVAATKIDAVTDPADVEALEAHVRSDDLPFARISAVTGEGLPELQETVWKHLSDARLKAADIDGHEPDDTEREVVARRAGAHRDTNE